MTNYRIRAVLSLVMVAFLGNGLLAQSPLLELLELSKTHYPLLKAKAAEREASEQNIRYERADLIPQLDAGYQLNYATGNNITGMFWPQQLLPISGPPSIENNYQMVSGSAASLLMDWQPFTFGKRQARMDIAKGQYKYRQADEQMVLLEHQVKFVNEYLDLWQSKAMEEAMKKNRDRYAFALRVARELASNGVKPGVDSARISALYLKSKIALMHAERQRLTHEAKLHALLGVDTVTFAYDSLLEGKDPKQMAFEEKPHPYLQRARNFKAWQEAKKKSVQRSLMPDFHIWGIGFARGSAINFDGSYGEPMDGLSFSRFNYGLGAAITLPLLQVAESRHKIKEKSLLINAAEEQTKEVELELQKEEKIAQVTLVNAQDAAAMIPEYLKSAQYAYQAMRARYEAGMINTIDLLQSQFELAEAEAEAISLKSELWKALLYLSAVKGDLSTFTQNLD